MAAARAVIFSQMVDDPSGYVDTLKSDPKLRRKAEGILKARHKLWTEATAVLKKAKEAGINAPEPGPEPKLDDILAEIERQRLFRIIEELVLWENTTNEEVLKKAREEIWQSWRRTCAENAGHLIRVLADGEGAAAELVAKLGAKAEPARELAYRLYTLCERKKRAVEALAYNSLVQAWPDLLRQAEEVPPEPVQGQLL